MSDPERQHARYRVDELRKDSTSTGGASTAWNDSRTSTTSKPQEGSHAVSLARARARLATRQKALDAARDRQEGARRGRSDEAHHQAAHEAEA
jgi:hypothetical protein